MSAPKHVPVLLNEVLDALAPAVEKAAEPLIVDATLGLGGHTEAMLERFGSARVLGIDRDTHAIELASERLAPYGDRVSFAHGVYDELPDILAARGITGIDGILFDLGVSSMQLDEADRGFAYARQAPLDMRMNDDDDLTAAEVLNTYSQSELTRILREYGEEKFAHRIAAEVVRRRANSPLENSSDLLEVLDAALPAVARRRGGHPAKRTFQALRIEVNDELDVLRRAVPAALDALTVGGRIVVLSYHSLEDRITKQAFADVTRERAPRAMPVVPPELLPTHQLITRGAVQASETERNSNPRAASVRMRVAERQTA